MERGPNGHKGGMAEYLWLLALSVGVAVGVAIGVAIGSIGAGVGIGTGTGVAVGLLLIRRYGTSAGDE